MRTVQLASTHQVKGIPNVLTALVASSLQPALVDAECAQPERRQVQQLRQVIAMTAHPVNILPQEQLPVQLALPVVTPEVPHRLHALFVVSAPFQPLVRRNARSVLPVNIPFRQEALLVLIAP